MCNDNTRGSLHDMKKLTLSVGALAVALLLSNAPAFAKANENGCRHSNNRAAGCSDKDKNSVKVPEPGNLSLLVAGIVLVGGAAVLFGRKRVTQN